MRAPRLVAAGTAAASLLLAGCNLQKPSPLVSVVSGGHVTHAEAASYCFDGQDPKKEPGSAGGCTLDATSTPPVIRVRPGDQVGVDVAKALSDTAWAVTLRSQHPGADGQQPQEQSSPVQDGHYFAFSPGFDGGPVDLQVRSLASSKPGAQPTGVWRFVLVPQ